MKKSIRSLRKAVKRFGDRFGDKFGSRRSLKLPKSRNPQLEKFEDRLLLSISPSMAGADEIDEGSVYEMQLSAGDDAVARWDIDWGDGTTTTGNRNDWGDDIRLNADGTWTASHVFADNMTTSITATAYDDIDVDAASAASASSVVSVADTAPVLTLKSSEPMKEGKTFAVILSSEDLGTDTIDGWTINWGDGQVSTGSMPEPVLESQMTTAVLPDFDVSRLFDKWDPETWSNLDSALKSSEPPQTQHTNDWGDGIIQITPNRWVAAHTYQSGRSYNVTASASDENGTYAAFDIEGGVDRKFGRRGFGRADFGDGLDAYCREMFVDDDGRIVMVGYVDDGTDRDYAIARFNADGTVDTTFYGDGTVVIDSDSLIDSGSVSMAGLEIVAGGDGASTLSNTSLISSAMFDAILQVDGVNIEADLLNASIAGVDTTASTIYGPLTPSDNLSITNDDGVLRADQSLVDDQGFVLTRLCNENGGLAIDIQSDSPSESSLSTATTEDGETLFSLYRPPVMVAMVSTGTSAKMYLDSDDPNSIKEGDVYTLSIEVNNLATGEEVTSLLIEWGDGTTSTGTPPQSGNDWGNGITLNPDGTWTATHEYDDGNYAIEVTATTTLGTVWEYHPPIPGDCNMDGVVSDIDATILAVNWGRPSGATWASGDFDDDGDVDSDDMAILSAHWLDNINSGDGQLIVDNVEPLITLSGTGSADEGDLYTLNLESSDPGDDTITVWEVNWGDSSTETFTKQLDGTWLSDGSGTLSPVPSTDNQWTATHYYADNGEYTVNATAIDEDCATGESYEAYGAYGTLDRHFGADATGWLTESFGSDCAWGAKVIVLSDGKILVVGYADDPDGSGDNDFVMARYDSDGILDSDFGSGGVVITDLGGEDFCCDAAIQSDGKIVLVGYSNGSTDEQIALVRYSADGEIDDGDPGVQYDGFGGNDTGIVLQSFASGDDCAYGLTLLPNDDIIIAGETETTANHSDVLFARFDSNGGLDTSFGSGGKLVFDGTNDRESARSVRVLWEEQAPSNSVLVGVGDYTSVVGGDIAQTLFFFDDLGTPVSIGSSGVVEGSMGDESSSFGLAIDYGLPNDKTDDKLITTGYIVPTGSSDQDYAIVRYVTDGDPVINDFVLDDGFDIDDITSGTNEYWVDFNSGCCQAFGVDILPSGQIITTGVAIIDSKLTFVLAGLDGSDGNLDDSFGTDGKLSLDFGDLGSFGVRITADQDENILVTGMSWFDTNDTRLSLARLYGEDAGHKVEISNVEPTLEVTVEGMVDDHVTLKKFEPVVINGTITDPGFTNSADGTYEYFGYSVDWGDGTSTYRSNWTERSPGSPGVNTVMAFAEDEHGYTETGTYTVTVTAWDDDMPIGQDVIVEFDVEVIVVPELVLTGDREIDEGSQYTLGIELINPGIDPISELTIDWGDGTQTTGTSSTDWDEITFVSTNSWTAAHTYTDDGNYAIQVWADKNTENQIWSYHPPIPGDANCDGVVGQTDLNILSFAYCKTGYWGWRDGDFSGDGNVDVADLSILGGHWGETFATADGQLIVNDVAPTMAAFPSLATYSVTPPSTFNQFANNSSLYVQDGSNPYVAGYSEPNVGNDYVISGEVTYDAMTELGFLARADLNSQYGYVLSFDPTNRYFNLIKLTGGGLFENIVNHSLASKVPEISIGDTFRITFELDGSNITGLLYDSNGQLLDTISATDTTYTDGAIGPWALNKGNGIEGTFSGMTITPTTVFPDLSASPQAPSTFTQSADNTNLYIHDDTGLFPYVASYSEPNVGNNYVISGEVTYDAITEMGFLARADVNTQCGYVLSFNPVNSHFKLIKQTGEWSYEMLADQEVSGITVSPGDTFKFVFELDGSNLKGELYDANDLLLDTINKSDATYIDGTIGPWALNISNGIEGTFSGMALKPLAAIDGATSVDEGSLYTLTLGEVFDPGDDTTASYTVNWGDGQSDTYTPAELVSSDRQVTHTYADGPATRTISVDITNEEDTYVGVASRTITVNNVAPTLTVSEEVLADDWRYGITVRASDPGDDTITSWEINWGDGTPNTTSTSEPGFNHDENAWTVFHDYAYQVPEDPYNITIKAIDEDCGVGESYELPHSVTVNAANVTPLESSTASDNGKTLSLAGDTSVYEGSEYSLGIQVSDQATLTVQSLVIDWGDGTPNTTGTSGSWGDISYDGIDVDIANWTAPHTYADNGYYPIHVTATFDDGTDVLNAYHNPLLTGDANRDGIVNDADATILASNWQMATGAAWQHGDFDGDGDVDSTDALEIENNWQQRSGVIVDNVPSELTAIAVSETQINLNWQDDSDTVTNYFIDKMTPDSGWTQIGTIAANETTFTDVEIAEGEGTLRYYRVRAINSFGVSTASELAFATTLPVAPDNLSVTSITGTQVSLTWQDQSDIETNYHVEQFVDGQWQQIGLPLDPGSETATIPGSFAPQTDYSFRVRASGPACFEDNQYSLPSNEEQATTRSWPIAPSELTVTVMSDVQINLYWTDNAVDETGYDIERSEDGDNWILLTPSPLASDTSDFSDTVLIENTGYFYRVQARNGFGNSSYCMGDTVTLPTAPTDLQVTVVSGSEMQLQWTDNSTGESSYSIEQLIDSEWQTIETTAANASFYAITGTFEPITDYSFRVLACKEYGDSYVYSLPSSVETVTTDAWPAAPSNFWAMPASGSQIDLIWIDNATNETGYEIERRLDGGTWTTIDNLGANTTSYSDIGLTEATPYFYRVRATSVLGNSSYCMGDTVTLPTAPTDLQVTVVSGSEMQLQWTDNSTVEVCYIIEQLIDGIWEEIDLVAPETESYTINGYFEPSTEYSFQVRAWITTAISLPSIETVNTLAWPTAPTDLTATLVSDTEIELSWTNSPDATSHTIEMQIQGSDEWTVLGTVDAPQNSFIATGLSAGGTGYSFQVAGANGFGSSPYSSCTDVVQTQNQTPTVSSPASSASNPVSTISTPLSVLGSDDNSESLLRYQWSAVLTPSEGAAFFSINNSNEAKDTTVTFTRAGNYTLQVTITDTGGLTTTSQVTVIVEQSLTNIEVTPADAAVLQGKTQQFTAKGLDQFYHEMTTPPTFTWSIGSGGVGTISSLSGLYTAPLYGEEITFTIHASSEGISGTANVAVKHSGVVVVNFDDLPEDTIVTDQYDYIFVSGEPDFPNIVHYRSGKSPFIGAPTPPEAGGDYWGDPRDHDLYIDFLRPANNLTFKHIYANEESGTVIGEVRVYENGILAGTDPIISEGYNISGEVDLSSYHGVSRIEIVNITDYGGICYDDFIFETGSPLLELTVTDDTNIDNTITAIDAVLRELYVLEEDDEGTAIVDINVLYNPSIEEWKEHIRIKVKRNDGLIVLNEDLKETDALVDLALEVADENRDFVVTAWYDGNNNGIFDNGEDKRDVDIHVVKVDLSIDSDNDGDIDTNDDLVEDIPGVDETPGKVLLVADIDSDSDGVVDWADGFDLLAGWPNDNVSKGASFVPMTFELSPAIDLSKVTIEVEYNASSPAAISMESQLQHFDRPSDGFLRIWTKDGCLARNKVSASTGGDFVAAASYIASELGLTGGLNTFYVEAINPSGTTGDQRITFRVYLDGNGETKGLCFEDSVRLTTTRIQLMADNLDGTPPFETYHLTATRMPNPVCSGGGEGPDTRQVYSVNVFDPRQGFESVIVDGVTVPIERSGGHYVTSNPFIVVPESDASLIGSDQPLVAKIYYAADFRYKGYFTPDDEAANPIPWSVSNGGQSGLATPIDGILHVDTTGGDFTYSATLSDPGYWVFDEATDLQVRFRMVSHEASCSDGTLKLVLGDGSQHWEIGILPDGLVTYPGGVRTVTPFPVGIGSNGNLLDGFFHVLEFSKGSQSGTAAISLDGTLITMESSALGGTFGLTWGDTGSNVGGYIEYDYVDWQHPLIAEKVVFERRPSDVIEAATVVTTSSDNPSISYNPSTKEAKLLAKQISAADQAVGKLVKEVVDEMVASEWDAVTAGYDDADCGAFGKEVDKRVAARLQNDTSWGFKSYKNYKTGVLIKNGTNEIAAVGVSTGKSGYTQIDVMYCLDDYEPKVGEVLDTSKVVVYDIKTSASGAMPRDQLRRLRALSSQDVRKAMSEYKYTMKKPNGGPGLVLNKKFTRAVKVIGVAGGVIAAGQVWIQPAKAEAKLDAIQRQLRLMQKQHEPLQRKLDAVIAAKMLNEYMDEMTGGFAGDLLNFSLLVQVSRILADD